MSELPDYMLDCLEQVAKSEGFLNYTMDIKPGSNHGDNFIGVMTSVVVNGVRRSRGKILQDKLNLLVKLPPSSPQRRKEFNSTVFFEREVIAYNKLLPTFIRFQKEKGLAKEDGFFAFPKCYKAVADEEKDHYYLIMEDLRPKSFAMWPKEKVIPLDHVEMLVKELGRYHGISFALKDQRPEIFEEFRKLKDIFSLTFKSPNMLKLLRGSYKRALDVLTDERHKQVMKMASDNCLEWFDDCMAEVDGDQLFAITHGDCWTNNLLFQYENGKPDAKAICIVDWQIIRNSSPCLDLLHNLFTATDKEWRDAHYMDVLKLYHSTLTSTVQKLGSDPEVLFSWDDFQREMKRVGKFAFLVAPLIIQVRLASSEDVVNLDEMSEEQTTSDDFDLVKGFGDKAQLVYNTTVRGLVSDLIELEYC